MTPCYYAEEITNRVMLHILTHLAPVIHNTPRFSSKYDMKKRYTEIQDKPLQVAGTQGATTTIDRSL